MASTTGNTGSHGYAHLNAPTPLGSHSLPVTPSAQSTASGYLTVGNASSDADGSTSNLTTPLLSGQNPSPAATASTSASAGSASGAAPAPAAIAGDSAIGGVTSNPLPPTGTQTQAPLQVQPAVPPTSTRRFGALNRLGGVAIIVLVAGPVLIIVALLLLALLWFASHDIAAWRYIVVNDYLMTAVAGLGKVIETSLQFTVSTSCAMLAAIALEGFHVLMSDAAEISNARLSGGAVDLFSLSWKQLRAKGPPGIRSWSLLLLCVVTTLTFLYSQLVTIILNTDIGLSNLGGFPVADNLTYGFAIHVSDNGLTPATYMESHGQAWFKKVLTFPTFAEYSEPPVEQEGVSDTGTTLRAFLPYASQQMRQNMQSYTGRTTVVDTRVTCQVPEISNVVVGLSNEDSSLIVIQGGISATRSTPRLQNETFQWPPDTDVYVTPVLGQSIPISCMARITEPSTSDFNSSLPPAWRASLCQLPDGGSNATMFTGGLVSEFQSLAPINMSDTSFAQDSINWGSAYLFLNVTTGISYNWQAVLEGNFSTPPAYQEREEWKDYIFSGGDLILSATLCYSSFMTANLPVQMESFSNRSEPTATFDFDTRGYVFPGVRAQLGEGGSSSLEQRGVLSLKPQRSSWLANSTDELPYIEPYIRQFANMKNDKNGYGNDANYTAFLWENPLQSNAQGFVSPDPFYDNFFQDIVRNGGSVAFALQSMYTVMASMSYYDQLPQFDATAPVARTSFAPVNQPLWWRGLAATTAIILAHFVASAIILVHFLQRCKFSLLGDTWATVAQMRSPETTEVFAIAPDMKDKEVEKWLKDRGLNASRVGLAVPDGQSHPGIVLAPPASGRGAAAQPQMAFRRRRP